MTNIAREEEINRIRETSLVETENISKRPRFGLFTKPPPLCLHDPYKDNGTNFRGGEGNKEDKAFQGDKHNKNISIYMIRSILLCVQIRGSLATTEPFC